MAAHCDVPDKTLLYSVPYHQDLFYEERIKKIHNLHYEIYITREEVEGYHFGRLDAKKFTYAKDTEFYVCGNPQAVDQIIHDLSEK